MATKKVAIPAFVEIPDKGFIPVHEMTTADFIEALASLDVQIDLLRKQRLALARTQMHFNRADVEKWFDAE